MITRIASHAGDGNIHLNILKPDDTPYEDWARRVEQNQQELYAFIYAHGGRLSGEHGIGFKRKHLMEEFTNPDELAMMKAVKKALDSRQKGPGPQQYPQSGQNIRHRISLSQPGWPRRLLPRIAILCIMIHVVIYLQGRVKFPIGGIVRERYGVGAMCS